MSANLLDVKNLGITFNGTATAAEGVTFSIAPQETLGLVGESGCGKSVCSLSILRLLTCPPAQIVSGEIWFEGNNLLKLREPEMRAIRGNKIAMVFQEPMTAFNPVYTVGYQVCEALHAHRTLSRKDAEELCVSMFTKVGIPSPRERIDAYPHQLSGGLRQRVMIAMALILKPTLLIADEPTTALDVTIQAQILELLKNLQREFRMAMLLISHDMGVIAQMADRVAVMYAGRIVETATTKEIFASPKHPYTQALLESIPRLGQNKTRLITIPGNVPSAANRPPGCAFHPRCPLKEKCCEEIVPEYRSITKDRGVACHLVP